MKATALIFSKFVVLATLACVTVPCEGHTGEDAQNHEFSGVFKLESCEPSCAEIAIHYGGNFPDDHFDKVESIGISVLDKLDSFWSTCDGKPPFEFNLSLNGAGLLGGTFMHNNLGSWSGHEQICDGAFSTDDRRVSLSSPQAEIVLEKLSDRDFALTWRERSASFSGRFLLKKISNGI